MPTTSVLSFSAGRLDALYNPEDANQVNVSLAPTQTLAAGTVLGQLLGTNGKITVTPTPTISGGYFTVTVGANTSAHIAWNASNSDIQTALEALASVGHGNVAVAGGPVATTAFTFTFQNALGYQVAPVVSVDDTNLTGSGHALTAVVTAAGSTGTQKYKAYASGNTDGSQHAKGLLQYACTVDGSGNVTLPGEWSVTGTGVPMFIAGIFACEDTVGLDAGALTDLGGALPVGTISHGEFSIG